MNWQKRMDWNLKVFYRQQNFGEIMWMPLLAHKKHVITRPGNHSIIIIQVNSKKNGS